MMVTKEHITAGWGYIQVTPSEEFRRTHTTSYLYSMPYTFTPSQREGVFIVRGLGMYLGILDGSTGRLTTDKGTVNVGGNAYLIALNRVLPCIWQGKQASLEKAGWTVEIGGCCCRCKTYIGLGHPIGFCPGCEPLVKLGVKSPSDVPCITNLDVARLQHYYWTTGHSSTLPVLRDACLDAGWEETKVEALIEATKALRTHYRRGERLPRKFLDFVGKKA